MSLQTVLKHVCPERLRKIVTRIRGSNLALQLVSGAFWSLIGAVSTRLFMLIAAILVARILGQEIFGEYSMVLSTVNSFVVFATLGISMTATKYIAQYRETDKERLGRIIGLSYLFTGISGFVVAVFFFILSPAISLHMMDAPYLVHELQLGMLFLLFAAINGAQVGILTGFQEFKTLAFANIFSGVVILIARPLGAYWGGLYGGVIGFGVSLVLLLVFYRYYILRVLKRHQIRVDYRNAWQEMPVIWRFSLPALGSGIMVAPVFWLCYTMLAKSTSGMAEVGIFEAARQIQLAVAFIPSAISHVTLPILVRSNTSQNAGEYDKAIKYNLLLNVCSAVAIAIPIMVFSKWIMSTYGKGFEEGTMTLCILVVASVIYVTNNILGQILASLEKMWLGFLFNAIWAVVFLAACYISLFHWKQGAIGAASSLLFAYFCHSVWQGGYYLYYRSSQRQINGKR